MLTPDQHAERAESLLAESEDFSVSSAAKASHERRAIAHATLSLRAPKPAPRKAPGPKPKPKTDEKKEKDS
jgi:hypothetical protein